MDASISEFFRTSVSQFTRDLDDFDRSIGPDAAAESEQLTSDLTNCINASLAACSNLERELGGEPTVLREVQARFRKSIAPWFDKSWFMRRALNKPRGYPGDYELLSSIYDGVAKSPGIGGYLDRYFLNTTLGRAVPARMLAVRQFLLEELNSRQGDVSMLNVACGSCREYVGGFSPTNHRQIHLTCVDNDTEALEFVKANVGPEISNRINLSLVRYNALRMTSARQNVQRFGRPDIIYSVGLCDYIPDEYLIPMLRGWRESLNDGGVVYVAFKDARLYTTEEYQWLVDWYFYQRTDEECRRLFANAGYIIDDLYEQRDATGVIINFIARNKRPAVIRIDGADQLPTTPQLELNAEPTDPQQAEKP